jgi:hypothetical protein
LLTVYHAGLQACGVEAVLFVSLLPELEAGIEPDNNFF